MPNRVLRDWTGSDRINGLSVHAERFFTRLIMKVDDYGCFFADTRLLKANLYPLLLDTIREADLLRWLTECQKAGLIVLYERESKKYLQILDFRQRLDRARSKFPVPTDNELREIVTDFPPESESETETKPKHERENGVPPPPPDPEQVEFDKFLGWIKVNASRVLQMKEQFTKDQFFELKKEFTAAEVSKVLTDMHNWEPLVKKNRNPYLTLRKWIKKDHNETIKPSTSRNSKTEGAYELADLFRETINAGREPSFEH